jgi:RNA polymerase sigma-70 factor, ECF subfamily
LLNRGNMEKICMSEPESVAPWGLARALRPAAAPGDDAQVAIVLFDELRRPLLRYLLTLGLAAEDAEEVVQEAFLALVQHLGRGGSRRNPRGWLFRVAHNLGLKRRLAARRGASAAAWDDVVATQPDPGENPEQQLATAQRKRHLEAALKALAEQDRWCLALRAEGLPYRDIGRVLGISLGSVAGSLARSLDRLSRAVTHV